MILMPMIWMHQQLLHAWEWVKVGFMNCAALGSRTVLASPQVLQVVIIGDPGQPTFASFWSSLFLFNARRTTNSLPTNCPGVLTSCALAPPWRAMCKHIWVL